MTNEHATNIEGILNEEFKSRYVNRNEWDAWTLNHVHNDVDDEKIYDEEYEIIEVLLSIRNFN